DLVSHWNEISWRLLTFMIDQVATAPCTDPIQVRVLLLGQSLLQSVEYGARNRGNDLAVVGVSGSKRRQHKLRAIGRFDIGDVMTRSAGPTGFGPQTKSGATLQCDAAKTMTLIVGIVTLTRVFAFQQLHHRGGARGVRGFSGHDLHHQAGGRVGGELVAVLAVWATRHAFA